MKGNLSDDKKVALALLDDKQIRTTGANLDTLQRAAITQIALVRRMESESALRAILVGMALMRVKHSLAHGEFMPWLKKNLDATAHRQANYYMRLGLVFLEKTKATKPEVLALPGDQAELSLDNIEGPARRLMEKMTKFVGDKSLNELLSEHAIKDGKALGGARKGGKEDKRSEEEKLAEVREFKLAELNAWLASGEQLLIAENVCQFLSAKEIERFHGQLLDLKTNFTKAIQPLLKKAKS